MNWIKFIRHIGITLLLELNWLKENASDYPVYVSFTLKDATHISDGTTLEQAVSAVDKFEQVFAIGINCISPGCTSIERNW
ncbi:hypothetical protein BTH53_03220 [Lactobacillus delbrueckii subsp. bulgaricus]|nr:hypothetical protein [Lactobacillus delbrueckii subsp. bulgaricus]